MNVLGELVREKMGIQALSEPVLIDECKHGFMSYRLELIPEQAEGKHWIRIQGTEFKGAGKNGRTRRAFAWPVIDALRPVELLEWTAQILAAAQPQAPVNDSRGAVGKFFGNLFGTGFINELNSVASLADRANTHIAAHLHKDKNGIMVTLSYARNGNSAIRVHLPLATVEKLQQFLLKLDPVATGS